MTASSLIHDMYTYPADMRYNFTDGRVFASGFVIGLWFSPPVKGSRPPPHCSFSLTMTDEDQAVMFGGHTPSGITSEARVLHLPTMVSHL